MITKRAHHTTPNRFGGLGRPGMTTDRPPTPASTRAAPPLTLGAPASAFMGNALLGTQAEVFAREISAKELAEKVAAVRQRIIQAPDFEMSFTKDLLSDPILARAFVKFYQLLEAGHESVAGQSAAKKNSARVMYSRLQVETFLEEFEKILANLTASKAEAPVDIASVGLRILERNSNILTHARAPQVMAKVLVEMAELPGLQDRDRMSFFTQLATLAVDHASRQENRTDTGRKEALDWLRTATRGLIELGAKATDIKDFMKEAHRISLEQDGAPNGPESIRTSSLELLSAKPAERAAAEVSLFRQTKELMDARLHSQGAGQALGSAQVEGFAALLEASAHSSKLFAEMPDFIEALTGHPKLRPVDSPEAEADAEPPAVYRPAAHEVDTQQAMLGRFVAMLGTMFPELKDPETKKLHMELTRKAGGLLADNLHADQSQRLSALVRQFTRHPETAVEALDLIQIIDDTGAKLDAARDAVISALENRNLDAAWDLYNSPVFQEDDGRNTARQADMLTAAARTVLETKGDLDGSTPALAWAGRAHLAGLEQGLQSNPPNWSALRTLLTLMTTDWEDWKLPAAESLEFVAKVQKELSSDESFHVYTPQLVGILAKHPEDDACMGRAKALVDGFRTSIGVVPVRHEFGVRGHAVHQRQDEVFLAMLQQLSRTREMAAFIPSLTEPALANFPAPQLAAVFAQTISRLGDFANKTALARSLPTEGLSPATSAAVALALASHPATHQQAREILSAFAAAHESMDVQAMDEETLIAFMRAEAAIRLAVPNLLSEQAATGLFRGYQAGKVSREVVELVPMYLPNDLIEKVLAEMPNAAELRQIMDARGKASEPDAAPAPAEPPAEAQPAA